ncbi:type II toxin-antitoxin system prevent-host-death family antitoxin [Nonomuraea sp. NPDC004702]
MSEKEIGLREGRAKFGDLVNRAEYAGQITYITRHGRRVAAIVPIHLVPQEQAMTVTLYETNSDILVIARGDDAWSLYIGGDHMVGQFAADAEAWVNGDWEPNEGDGQNPTDLGDGLKEVATWDHDNGVTLLVRADSLGGAARDYLPSPVSKGVTFERDNDNPNWGTDTIVITVNGNEVTEEFTVDGVSDKGIRSFSGPSEVENYLHARRVDLTTDGYREQ